jgi:outer membrane protein assembly factor BamB
MTSSNAKAIAERRSPDRLASVIQAQRAACIAATFCVLVGGYMVYQHALASERDPWKSPQLLALKEKLRATPTDETVKGEIRRLDLEFRQRYQRRLALDTTGGWLLVGGVVALLFAAKPSAKLRALPWLPRLKPEAASEARKFSAQARWSVAVVGVVVSFSLLTLAFTASSPLPKSAAELDKLLGKSADSEASARVPTLTEFRAHWPRFRGMDGDGNSANTAFGTNVLWKSPVPAPGFNSPVVWSNRIFVSGGDAVKREVMCFNATDGKLLWQRAVEKVPDSPTKQPEVPEMTGFAVPTTACDGQRVFALFANGDLAAFTHDGAPSWSRNIGVPKDTYGHATSLAIWPGKLIVQLDQDEGAPGGSKLLAFDCATGRQLWERGKPTHGSWASPIIVEAAGKTQIITLALPFVMSHALADGNELWRADLMEGEVTPSPLFAGGLVIVVSPAGKLIALRPDGAGDVTKSHAAWMTDENIPDITSPVSNGELVFTVMTGGGLAAFDLKDGKKVWEKDLEMEVQSSPAIAGNQLLVLVLGTKGDLLSLAAGREFKELGRVKLEDSFHASPAFAGGRMFLRGATNLWCLGIQKEVASAR